MFSHTMEHVHGRVHAPHTCHQTGRRSHTANALRRPATQFPSLRHRHCRNDVSVSVLSASPTSTLEVSHAAEADPILLARREAALQLSSNRTAYLKGILDNSGLTRYRGSPFGRTVVSPNGYDGAVSLLISDAVAWHLQRVSDYLLTGQVGTPAETAEEREVGAATMAYFRYMLREESAISPAALKELRGACDEVFKHLY